MPRNKSRRRVKAKGSRTRPVNASLRLSAGSGSVSLRAARGGEGELPRFSMLAYTGAPMRPSGWWRDEPIVVDLAGLEVSAKSRPILRDHDPAQVVGHSEDVRVDSAGLHIDGVVSGAGPAASEVVESSRRGFPWQASIGFTISALEEIEHGERVVVNGRDLVGPLAIARRSVLNESSFVALGADDDTAALAASKGASAMTFKQWCEAKGFDESKLTEAQRATLLQTYNAEQAAADADDGDDADEGDDDAGADASDDADDDAANDDGEGDAAASRRRGGRRAGRVRASLAELRRQEADETVRIAKIRRICGGRHNAIEAMAIDGGWSVDKTELEVLRASRPNVPGVRGTSSDASPRAIEVAVCRAAGISERTLQASYRPRDLEAADRPELRNFGLHSLMAEVVRAAGGSPRYGRFGDDDIRAAFQAERTLCATGGFSTISLSGILSNVANRAMLDAYQSVPSVVPMICAERDVNDFKEVKALRLTTDAPFAEVGPGGELKHATLTEQGYANRLKTYGQIVTLDRQTIINDDLGAFLALPRQLGMRAAARRERLVISTLLAATTGAGAPNFFRDDVNFFDGADTALGIDSMTVAEQAFFERTDETGEPVLMQPSVVLVAPANKTKADRIYSSENIASVELANAPERNPHAGKFKVAMSPYLGASVGLAGASDDAWYLFANPATTAALEVVYLRGQRTPTMRSGETSMEKLGMSWSAHFDFGVALQDSIAVVKMKGVA